MLLEPGIMNAANDCFVADINYEMSADPLGIPATVRSAVFLAGGGQDSYAAMLHFIKNLREFQSASDGSIGPDLLPINIYPIYMDYGQLCKLAEIEAIQEQINIFRRNAPSKLFKFHELTVLPDPLTPYIKESQSLLTGGSGSAYIEYRNLRYLTTAAAYANLKGARWVIAGLAPAVMSIDSGFNANLFTQAALNQNTLHLNNSVRIYAPMVQVHRSAVVRYIFEKSPSWAKKGKTFSCYTPKLIVGDDGVIYAPCGECLSCQVRIGGHRIAGWRDDFSENALEEYEAAKTAQPDIEEKPAKEVEAEQTKKISAKKSKALAPKQAWNDDEEDWED